jgi:hypothetical protein
VNGAEPARERGHLAGCLYAGYARPLGVGRIHGSSVANAEHCTGSSDQTVALVAAVFAAATLIASTFAEEPQRIFMVGVIRLCVLLSAGFV